MPFLSNFEDKKYFLRKMIKQHDCRTSGHSEKQLLDICHKCCEFWVCVQLSTRSAACELNVSFPYRQPYAALSEYLAVLSTALATTYHI